MKISRVGKLSPLLVSLEVVLEFVDKHDYVTVSDANFDWSTNTILTHDKQHHLAKVNYRLFALHAGKAKKTWKMCSVVLCDLCAHEIITGSEVETNRKTTLMPAGDGPSTNT